MSLGMENNERTLIREKKNGECWLKYEDYNINKKNMKWSRESNNIISLFSVNKKMKNYIYEKFTLNKNIFYNFQKFPYIVTIWCFMS